MTQLNPPVPQPRYPSRCAICDKKEVYPAAINYQTRHNHDGRQYDLAIENLPVTQCQNCHEIYFTDESDEHISSALRQKLNLLSPLQIRANLKSLGLKQKDFAQSLGAAPETVSRWLSGTMIQSRAMDNLLRSFFGCSEVRENLSGKAKNKKFGTIVKFAERRPAKRRLSKASRPRR